MHIRHRGVATATVVLALTLAGGALAACGDSGQNGGTSPSPAATTPAAAPSAVSSSAPTTSPSPSPLDTTSMSEEELAKATEDSLEQTAAAAGDAATAAAAVSSDGTVGEDEVVQIVVSCQNAEQLVGYTASVLDAYSSEYAAYAGALLDEIEQMNQYLMDIDEELGTLLEYAQAAESTAEEISALAAETSATAQATADQLAATSEQWASRLSEARAQWEAAARDTRPTEVAGTRAGALQSAGVYLQTLNQTLQGGQLTADSLTAVYEAGANAVASLKSQGGQLAKLGAEIEKLTGMLARGELPQVKAQLPQVESLFP